MKVWTIPHTLFAARHLVTQIQKLGIECTLVSEIIPEDEDIYIIYGAINCPRLPKNYIVYQTEIAGSHFFNPRYLRIIRNALAVWEYSKENTGAYSHSRVSIVPPGINPQPVIEKTIPVLFYGWIEGSPRREKLLEKIREVVPVKVVTNIVGPEMWNVLLRSKVVLNLHYYPDSPLEVFRINEALSHNCLVVSEPPLGTYFDLIECAENAGQIADKLIACSSKSFNPMPSKQRLDNFFQIKNALRIVRGVKPEAFHIQLFP